MITNPVIENLLNRKSIRKYTDDVPSDEVIHSVVRAGQQAPFAHQMCSVLLSRQRQKHPFKAPLLFTICVDAHRMELVMARRNWKMATCDLSLLFFGIQDAVLMAENMVVAAESLGMGSVFIGQTPYQAGKIIKRYKLPQRVFPLVELCMGYPAETPPPRPRYPLEFTLFEDKYPEFDEETIRQAMAVMDEGYMGQGYYRKSRFKIPLENDRQETYTYDTYGWTEHISRKLGQWLTDPREILEALEKCGFQVGAGEKKEENGQ
jgi:FMN reductase [NAD(P)H]